MAEAPQGGPGGALKALANAQNRLLTQGLVALLGCMASTWLVLGPLAANLLSSPGASWWRVVWPSGETARYIGGGIDFSGTIWTYDRVRRALLPWVADPEPVFAPIGMDVATAQGAAWMDALAALPLVQLMGAPEFYNAWVLLALVSAQLATVALLRGLGSPLLVSLGLSAAVIYNPFMLRELLQGRPTQVWIVAHALFLLGVVRLLKNPNHPLRKGAIAGLFLAAACLTYWFSGVAVGLLGGGVFLAGLLGREGRLDKLKGGAMLALTAILSAGLAAWPLVSRILRGEEIQGSEKTQLLDISLLGLTVPVTGALRYRVAELSELVDRLESHGVSTTLLLAGGLALLLLPAWRRSLPWGLGGLALSTVALGGAVNFDGTILPTAFAAIGWVFPPLSRCHFPERLLVASHLGLACAAGVGLAWLATVARGRVPPLVTGIVSGGMGLWLVSSVAGEPALHPPTTTKGWEATAFYQELATRYPGGIIDVPLISSNEHYAFQVIHGKAVLGGPGINGPNTRPPGHAEYVADNTVLTGLEAMAASANSDNRGMLQADLDRLVADGFGIVVVHLDKSASSGLRYASILGDEYFHDRNLVAFPLVPSGAP